MPRGKPHSEETKAAAMAALLAGQGVSEVAAAYKLNEATVRNWKRRLPKEQLTEVNAKKDHEFGTLIANYLGEVLTTLSVQAVHFRDSAWLKEQSASELAVVHGVLTDKAIRILAAAESATGEGESVGE